MLAIRLGAVTKCLVMAENAGPKLGSSFLCLGLQPMGWCHQHSGHVLSLQVTPSQIHPKMYPGIPQEFVYLDVDL